MQLDLTPDCKVYDKYKRKFMGAVHAAILDTGSGSIMPAYLQDTLMQSIESIKVRRRTPAVHHPSISAPGAPPLTARVCFSQEGALA